MQLGSQTDAVMQVISRHRYHGGFDPEVSWVFFRHDFSPDYQMRVGRLGTEFYMLGDSRLIVCSNIAVRPPADFFAPLVFSYMDGFDATARTALGNGIVRANGFLR